MTTTTAVTLDDLTEPFDDAELPWLDRAACPVLRPGGVADRWRRDGYVILPGLIGDDLLDAYADAWQADNADRPGGWPYNTPYMHVPAVRDLCCTEAIADALQLVIGEPCGVHLNLTGWRSTTRDWHQDGYLNPDSNRDWYAAVWIALDDIHPDAGPFEFIPGSHRAVAPIRQDATRRAIAEQCGPDAANSPLWPRHSEAILTPLVEQWIAEHPEFPVHRFYAQRGDVLIWHARLLHRGSRPNDPDLERRACIAHYSGITHRPDFPAPAERHGGGWFFPIDEGGHR